MAESLNLRFFDKEGTDMNLGPSATSYVAFGSTATNESYVHTGRIFFDKVSTGLIESENAFILMEARGSTASYELRRVTGEAVVTGGNPTIVGNGSKFDTELQVGIEVKIGTNNFTVSSISGPTSMTVSPVPSTTTTSTDFYWYDYKVLNELRSSPRTTKELLTASWVDEGIDEFFFYAVNYNEDVPFIERPEQVSFQMADGSGDSIDPLSGRPIIGTPNTVSTQLNIGFQASEEVGSTQSIFEKELQLSLDKYYSENVAIAPVYNTETMTFHVTGIAYQADVFTYSKFEIRGYGASASSDEDYFVSYTVGVTAVGTTGAYTAITFDYDDNVNTAIGASNFGQFKLLWTNSLPVAKFNLYAEAEPEDTRLKLTLENFGKNMDHDKEFIFRESDVNEDLPNNVILNNKRKELLLEGDNIYPYLGSYKALINIINYFGYNDVRIKEYFLNVDEDSPNYGKYLHLLIPKDAKQRKEVKKAWEIVPSKIYKKLALFGLFYDINRVTDEEDIYGIPEVEDAFQFSIEEVLIKLFGLKELLKKQFLPLNARIYDITGEGIYFERIRIDSWSDSLHHLVVNLADRPVFTAKPEKQGYITDLRRIDNFYVEKFKEQGLSGFLGASAASTILGPTGFTGPMTEILGDYIGSYPNYVQTFLAPSDPQWSYYPPGIFDPLFNLRASQLLELPDDNNIPVGAPVLLETEFDLAWDDADFTWNQISILDTLGDPMPTTLWTWDNIGRGQSTEMRWVVTKGGINGFSYDSGRLPIDNFAVNYVNPSGEQFLRVLHAVALPFAGVYDIALYLYDTTNNFSVEFKKYEVLSKEVDFSSIHRAVSQERTWDEFETSEVEWNDVHGPWYYPVHSDTTWDEYGDVSWDALDFIETQNQSLFKQEIDTRILEIGRQTEYVLIEGDFTEDERFSVGNFLFLTRPANNTIFNSLLLPAYSGGTELIGLSGGATYSAIVQGASGNNYFDTNQFDTTISLTGGDSLFIQGAWYDVTSVGTTAIEITAPLPLTITGSSASFHTANQTFEIGYSGSVDLINTYASLLITDTSLPYTQIDPEINYYGYTNVLSHSLTGSQIVVKSDDNFTAKDVISKSQTGQNLYITNGVYADTFSIEITNIALKNGNTYLKLKDPTNELYKLDGNFDVRVTSYDIDYAETRIGIESLQLKLQDEVTWSELEDVTWDMTEFHANSLCGFTIPFVQPSGSIQIDEYEQFYLSGNPGINSTQTGLEVAALELNASENEGVRRFTYDVMPDDPLFIASATGASLSCSAASIGATGITMSNTPIMLIPAEVTLTFSGGTLVSGTVSRGGLGYSTSAEISIGYPTSPTGSQAVVSLIVSSGSVVSLTIDDPGSGYTVTPPYSVSGPPGHKADDNYIWTGAEWVKIVDVQGTQLILETPLTSSISAGAFMLSPYEYHKQIIRQPLVFQQYYFFIHAEARNPGSENLSYVRLDYGNESEWVDHPYRSYSYPLRNSLLYVSNSNTNLDNDHLYQKWVYEGKDYPPQQVAPIYSSPDRPDLEARIPFIQTLQEPFTFVDTVVSSGQKKVSQYTPVLFTYDPCKIPGKMNPKWKITNEEDGVIKVVSTSKSLFWNFTQNGEFTVELEIEDANGNLSSGKKTSFIVVDEL